MNKINVLILVLFFLDIFLFTQDDGCSSNSDCVSGICIDGFCRDHGLAVYSDTNEQCESTNDCDIGYCHNGKCVIPLAQREHVDLIFVKLDIRPVYFSILMTFFWITLILSFFSFSRLTGFLLAFIPFIVYTIVFYLTDSSIASLLAVIAGALIVVNRTTKSSEYFAFQKSFNNSQKQQKQNNQQDINQQVEEKKSDENQTTV